MLNTNLNLIGISSFDRFSQEESRGYIPFRLQYVLVSGGGGAAAGNNSFTSGSDLPKIGVAGSGGVIVTGSFCVEPFISYPITIGKGGAGGIKSTTSPIWTGSNGGNTIAFGTTAYGGEGGKLQFYITSSDYAGNGSGTSASLANGGSGSLWDYNLPGPPFPDGYGGGGTGGDYITNDYYSGGGAGIVVSQSFQSAVPIIYNYLIVGGGGAGASRTQLASIESLSGGGGGAVLSGSWNPFTDDPNWTNYYSNNTLTFPVKVGAGGISLLNASGTNGTSSSLFGFSAQGGFGANNGNGDPGGNAGTGSANSNFTTLYTGGTGTFGGGGAGARANGTAGADLGGGIYAGGNGGNGALWSGSYYAGGGGGAVTPGGGTVYSGTSGLGSSNAGGGGAASFAAPAENGRSGSVVIMYDTSGLGDFVNRIKGGTITTSGSFRIHTFSSSSNFTIESAIPTLQIEYIVVGGGGAAVNNTDTCNGGATFGGGGGAAITGSFVAEPIVKTYPIVVGAGGIGKYGCNPGTGSEAGTSTAFGVSAQGGRSGDSTGTIAGNSGTGSWGLTTPFLGGDPTFAAAGAGGGGAAADGQPVNTGSVLGTWKDGNGGAGLQWVDGRYYGGGGYGGTQDATDYSGQYGITSELFPSSNFYSGRGGGGVPGNFYFSQTNGNSGSVVIRYFGTGSKATGGQIEYSGSYTYHYFTASGNFTLNENTSSMFTSGLPGTGSLSYFSPSGSTIPTLFHGGGSAASYYNQNGVSGSDGVVVLRYEGLPLAQGGQVITTQYYTYHVFTSSANLEVFGYESNPNVNPC